MGSDLLFFLQNFSTIRFYGFHRIVEPAFDRKINKRAGLRRLVFVAHAIGSNAQTARGILFVMRQKAVFGSALGHFANFVSKNRRVKLDRTIEIRDRNICPVKCVGTHGRMLTGEKSKSTEKLRRPASTGFRRDQPSALPCRSSKVDERSRGGSSDRPADHPYPVSFVNC